MSLAAGSRASSSQGPDPSSFKFVSELARELSTGRVDLPSFPEAAARVQQVLSDDSVTSERIALVVSADAGLAARVLTLANSTLLHRGGAAVTNLKTAVTRIGYENIRTAALAYANAQLQRAPELLRIRAPLERCWQRGMRVASLAHAIAKESRAVRPDEAMLGGLLHNIGMVYILARSPRDSAPDSLMDGALRSWHPSIGQALIENWKLPEEIALAVGGQLELERLHEGPADLHDLLVVAVHLAEQMAHGEQQEADAVQIAAAGALGLNDSALVRIMLESQTEMEMLQAALG
ncbi:MAG TPA: HDOD domain-containing protein [Steroidobacteraceae bacterium]|nr:HDOD domain-containing protein [Steroidobacteraceae bacterium]